MQSAAHLAIESTPEYFSIFLMMFLIGKTPAAKKLYDGKVLKLGLKQHKQLLKNNCWR